MLDRDDLDIMEARAKETGPTTISWKSPRAASDILDLVAALRAERENVAKLSGDRCDVCDEDGLIYVVTGYEGDGREIEEAEVCSLCEGTRSGVTSRLNKELRAERARADRLAKLLGEARELLREAVPSVVEVKPWRW